MEHKLSASTKRARPVLGTIVEITIYSEDIAPAKEAIAKAFEKIQELEKVFSFFNPDSEISKLCQNAHRATQKVSDELWKLLKISTYFYKISNGVFDVSIPGKNQGEGYGNCCDIVFKNDRSVFFNKKLLIDFGGIAKGYIVDRAIEILIKKGITSAVVNAGGDIRTLGRSPHTIHIRDPSSPQQLPISLQLKRQAIACSGGYFAEDKITTKIYDPKLVDFVKSDRSLCVVSPRCVLSDALTKIAYCDFERAKSIAKRWDSYISIVSI